MYKPLEEPCKSCLGCMRLENPEFVADKNCTWKPTAKDYMKLIKENLGVQEKIWK